MFLMASSVKTGIGFLIPFGAIIGFVLSIIAENYILGIFFAVAGILIWLLYLAVMNTATPDTMGNFIILFGVLLAMAVFMNFGWEQNIWGGIEFKTEGSVMALMVLFFGTLIGVMFRQRISDVQSLTTREKELVDKALLGHDDPRVIVVKQEAEEVDNDEEEDDYEEYDEYDYEYPYYYDEDDEYEYEDEEED